MKQFAVIGLGRFGSSLARTLFDMGHEVLGVDISAEHTQRMMDHVTQCIQADSTDEEVLNSLGLRNFDAVVVSIGHDMQASILTTVLVKDHGVKFVVAKANSALHGKVLERIGADKVVYPERDMGERVAHSLSSSNVLDYIDISPEYTIMEFVASDRFNGKTLGQLNLRTKYGVNVMAIKRGEHIEVAPEAEDVITKGDVLIIFGKQQSLNKITND